MKRLLWMWMAVIGAGLEAAPEIHNGQGLPADGPALRRRTGPGESTREIASLAVVEYLNAAGAPPAASLQSLKPVNDTENARWQPRLEAWREARKEQLATLKTLARSNGLTEETRGALGVLKKRLEEWEERDREGAYGGQVLSDPAQALAEEITEGFLAYGKAYDALASQPALSSAERERIAFERAKAARRRSSEVESGELKSLSPHHRQQITRLVELRDTLFAEGGFERFAERLLKDSRTTRKVEDVAQR